MTQQIEPMASARGRPFDLVANRALLFVVLTGFGVAAYALTVAVVGPVVPFTGAAAVLFGGASAAILLFIRDWAQRGVDWLLYGDRNDPQRALLRVGRELASAADPAGLVPILVQTIAESLRLSFIEVRFVDHPASLTVGQRPHRVSELPLVHQGRTIGVLRAGRRGEQLSRGDRRLTAGVAPQLAAAAETLRLHETLSAARERIVRAREEERRRLRGDLHDVLGPALAGVGLGVDAARARARRDPEGADELLADVQTEVRNAVTEMRRIVDGLRPPALDEMGLAGAVSHHARVVAERRPEMCVEVHAARLPTLAAAVEVVAYLIIREALTNAVRHARPDHVVIALTAQPDELRVEVRDDGAGLPAPADRREGIGLDSMAARAEEIGGALSITTPNTGGTVVTARLPLRTATVHPS